MGEPIFIKIIAEKMISLAGLKLKNKRYPKGDIVIYTGKRPGENYMKKFLSPHKVKNIAPIDI